MTPRDSLSALISTMPNTSARKASGRWSRPREAETTEGEALPRVAMTSDFTCLTPTSATARTVCDNHFATVSRPDVHNPTTIVRETVVGQHLRHGVPVAGREVRQEALEHSACRVLQPRRRRLSSSNFAIATSRSASSNSSERLSMSPSTVSTWTSRHSASKPSC